jgi:2',3'-cyclic-nucleotide 2'-phosphodiesterase/3'-nucleotidase
LVWLALATPLESQPAAESGQTVTLTVLATTDLHGTVWPYDYLQGRRSERGLAKVSSYVKQVRARQPDTLVLDCGDTFQGTPIAYLYATERRTEPNPVVAAMNAIGYDAMTVGNHEFNFGVWTLWRLKEQAEFPILGANVLSSYRDYGRDFAPFVIRRVGGVRVAILGLVTPAIPYWDPPEHRVGYTFRDPVETAREWVPKLRRKADLVIVVFHSGLGRNPESGEVEEQPHPGENRAWDLAEQVLGIDAIFYGHSHRELAGREVNGALLVQAKNWAQSVAEAEFVMERDAVGGDWRLRERRSRTVAMNETIPDDPEILELTRAAHEETERYLSTIVGSVGEEVNARTGRIEDHPLVDLVHRVQLHYGDAEASLASLFSTRTRWPAGPLTVRDVYRLYFYENKLYTVEITGAQLKEALEYAARSYKTFPWEPGTSPFADFGFNLDMADGVSYKIDLTRPPGNRIADLRFEGRPLASDHKLRLALNSYRWSGGGQFEMLRHARIVGRTEKGIRDLIVDYLRKQKDIEVTVNNNWEIVPEEARQALHDWVQPPQAWTLPEPIPVAAAAR